MPPLKQVLDIVLIFFHTLVLQEYWVLTESRIPLGGVRIVALSIMNRLSKTESAIFLDCRFSLFLKDPFSRLFIVITLPKTK